MPSWLTALTGGQQFANNPANNFQATLGDGLQGIGHSMMQHYRGQGGQPSAQGNPAEGLLAALTKDAQPQVLPGQAPQQPQLGPVPTPFSPQPGGAPIQRFNQQPSIFSRFLGQQF